MGVAPRHCSLSTALQSLTANATASAIATLALAPGHWRLSQQDGILAMYIGRLCVCASVRLCVCASVRLCICVCVSVSVYLFVCVSDCLSACVRVCACVCVSTTILSTRYLRAKRSTAQMVGGPGQAQAKSQVQDHAQGQEQDQGQVQAKANCKSGILYIKSCKQTEGYSALRDTTTSGHRYFGTSHFGTWLFRDQSIWDIAGSGPVTSGHSHFGTSHLGT